MRVPVDRERLVGQTVGLSVAFAVSFPLLIPHHRHPIPTFYPEWWSLTIGTFALGFAALAGRPTIVLPRAALPLLALTLLILIQWVFGLALPALAAFTAGMLLWTAALVALAEDDRTDRLPPALAWGLAGGALAGAAAGLAQWLGAPAIDGLLSPVGGGQVWGNLQQRNHLAIQMVLGLAAIAWLRGESRCPGAVAAAALALLVFVGVATASRSFWAALAGLAGVAGWIALRLRDEPSARRGRSTVFAALLLALLVKTGFLLTPGSGAAGERLLRAPQSDSVRLGLLRTSVELFAAAPVVGVGWGRFMAASFAVATPERGTTPGEHAHNLPAQIAAETGLLGLGIVVVALWPAFAALHRPRAGPPQLGLLVLAPLGVYSLVEYPLWYSFFLAPTALALGLVARPTTGRPPGPALARRLLLPLTAAGLAALFVLRQDYAEIERTMRWPLADPGETPLRWEEVVPRMTARRRDSAYAPWIDYSLASALPLDTTDPQAALRMIELAMASFPSEALAFKRAIFLARSGRGDEARTQLATLRAIFPESADDHRRQLDRFSATVPETEWLLREPDRP